MHTVQPYDKINNTLVYMHLWGDDKDAYWGNYDLGRAIAVGMQKNEMPYSGEYGFVDTYSYWPITHMVAPKEEALACDDCHAEQGRLNGVTGVYVPGSGTNPLLNRIALGLIGLLLLGIVVHALVRVLFGKRGEH